jgi:hypothetical protein
LLFDDRVNVGNGDQNLGGPVGHGFGNGKLVQIARIIIVNGAPEKVPEIVRRSLNLHGRPVDSVKLGERRGRKIWNQPFFEHHPMGNSLQDRAVLSVVYIRHIIAFL